jgi:hypothetical protein
MPVPVLPQKCGLTKLPHHANRGVCACDLGNTPGSIQGRYRVDLQIVLRRHGNKAVDERPIVPSPLPTWPRARSPPVDNLVTCRAFLEADARTRTGDPFITSEVLYQLSYVGG